MLKNHWRIIFAALSLIIILSCANSPSAPSSQSSPVPPKKQLKTCNGWRFRLYQVETFDDDYGYWHFKGYVAIENVDSNYKFNSDILYDADLQMTTTEGYVYPIRPVDIGFRDSFFWVPIGFRFSGYATNSYRFSLAVSTSKESSGHIVKTPCGDLDFDNPETSLRFPTDLPSSSFLTLGSPIKLSNGSVLRITSIKPCSGSSGNCIYFSFTNADKGYGYNKTLYGVWLDSDGMLVMGDFPLIAGPGTTINDEHRLSVRSVANNLLILSDGNDSWVLKLDE